MKSTFSTFVATKAKTRSQHMTESIIIFTDVGEEIDDEIALFWLFNSGQCSANLTIVFTQGALNAKITPKERHAKFKKYFPNAPKATYIDDLNSLTNIKNQTYTKMLQIAPLRGVSDMFFADNTIEKLYLMGQRDTPSLNTCKSFGKRTEEVHWQEYDAQLVQLVDVPTVEIGTVISRQVPFTSNIIQKLPDEFQNEILNKAYEQFVGRVPASLPYCYNVTFYANYPTLMAYVAKIPAFQVYASKYRDSDHVKTMASEFYTAITTKPASKSEDMIKVKDMILVVEFMTGGRYSDSSLQKGADHFEGYEYGREVWKTKVKTYNCSLTPAYDLLAMYVMVNGLTQSELTDASELTRNLESSFA